MATNLSGICEFSESGEDERFAQAKRGGGHGLSDAGEVVFVGAADFLDQTVQTESLQQPRNLAATLLEQCAQVAVPQAADGELATDDGLKEIQVIIAKE